MKTFCQLFFFFSVISAYSQISSSCLVTPSGTNISSGYYQPTSITTNDFNNDGKFDLAVANYGGSGMVSVLMGNGNATFVSAVNYTVNGAEFIISNDFNNDGKIDLVSAKTNSVSFFAGSGLGTFLPPIQYTVGANVISLTSADINGDGNIDLASVVSTGSISVMLGNGAGSFVPSVFYLAGSDPNSVSSGDFNSDGKSDLVVTNRVSNNISILLSSNSGSLSPAVNYTVGSAPISVVASDLNGDNIIDLAVVNTDYGTKNVSVLIGQGSGSFSYSASLIVDRHLWAITSGDVNGDGIIDLITANKNSSSSGNSVSVLLGTGLGNFSISTEYLTDYDSRALVSRDFDNDGKMDVAVINNSSYNITILKGTSDGLASLPYYTTAGPADKLIADDFNNDGKVDVAFAYNGCSVLLGGGNGRISSINTFTTTYVSTSISSGDFNNDGNKDILLGHRSDGFSSISLGTGLGTFSNPMYYYGSLPGDVFAPSDFNNDGNIDYAAAGTVNNRVYIYLGTGLGTFSLSTSYATSCLPKSITTGDFNLDGKIDVVALTDCNGSNVHFFQGNGNGTFLAPTTFSSSGFGELISSSDLNSDGKLDLVTANAVSNNVSIFLGTGTGSFNSIASQTISAPPTSLSIADVNEDNIPDITITNGGTLTVMSISPSGSITSVSNLNNRSTTAVVADFNNDGKNDFGIFGGVGSTSGVALLLNTIPSISLSAQNPICLGNSVTITASGANNYVWNTGAYTSSITVSPTSNTTYTVTSASSPGCTALAVKTISVSTIPTISIIGTNTVCINSGATFTSTGALTYSWNTGSTSASISVSPTITTAYSVTGTNSVNCSSTATINVVVDSTCQDVWPGDANSDGLADNLDVLELGLHYTQTGPSRASISNNWQSYFTNNWTGTITNGKNLNHSDCNGDGTINDNDTLAIYNNYGLTHAFKPAQTNTVNPQLSIVPDQTSVVKGTWGTASVYLGNATSSITNINGLAFTINFDNTLIEPNSIYIEYQNSFIDAGQNLHFRKLDFANSKLFTASTHTVSNNVSGFGKIATLHYQIKSSLATDQVLNLGISQANQSDASGAIVPLSSGTGTLMVMGTSVGLQELNGNIMSISPNPTNGSLTINSKTELQKIEVVAITGQVLLSEVPTNVYHTLHLDNFANGIYLVNLYQNNYIIKREKVILNK